MRAQLRSTWRPARYRQITNVACHLVYDPMPPKVLRILMLGRTAPLTMKATAPQRKKKNERSGEWVSRQKGTMRVVWRRGGNVGLCRQCKVGSIKFPPRLALVVTAEST